MKRDPMRIIKHALAAAILPGLLLAACASSGRDEVKTAAEESLAAGDFQKAIDAYREPFRKNPGSGKPAADYAAAVESIKATADGARGRGDFALAGRIYRLLLDNAGDLRTLAAKLTFNERELETAAKFCRIAEVDGQARRDLKAGRFRQVLDAYSGALKEYRGDKDLAGKALQALRDIKAAGDAALAANDLSPAGRTYALLLGRFRDFEGLKPAPFDRTSLAEALGRCRDGLTEAGLTEYRKGNLAGAIAFWESLLAFDPDNAEIKKAVETAKTQLKKLADDRV